MCLGIPGRVVELLSDSDQLAKVEVEGVRRTVSIGLLEDDPARPGDWVLIHVGFAMAKIDEREAAMTLEALRTLGQPYGDEMAAISETGPPG
jgi:hydrogenase expression/formation protein HypC